MPDAAVDSPLLLLLPFLVQGRSEELRKKSTILLRIRTIALRSLLAEYWWKSWSSVIAKSSCRTQRWVFAANNIRLTIRFKCEPTWARNFSHCFSTFYSAAFHSHFRWTRIFEIKKSCRVLHWPTFTEISWLSFYENEFDLLLRIVFSLSLQKSI